MGQGQDRSRRQPMVGEASDEGMVSWTEFRGREVTLMSASILWDRMARCSGARKINWALLRRLQAS